MVFMSDIAVALAPLVLGMGSGRFVPAARVCGTRPALQPPNWAFAVVWTALYVLLGISACLVWRASGRRWTKEMSLFAGALLLTMTWWLIFARVCMWPLAAATLAAVGIVWVAVAWRFWMVSKPAAVLIVPLLVWVAFATYLTVASG